MLSFDPAIRTGRSRKRSHTRRYANSGRCHHDHSGRPSDDLSDDLSSKRSAHIPSGCTSVKALGRHRAFRGRYPDASPAMGSHTSSAHRANAPAEWNPAPFRQPLHVAAHMPEPMAPSTHKVRMSTRPSVRGHTQTRALHPLGRRYPVAGVATLATLMVLLLLLGMVALLSSRVIQGEQMGSEALVQGHQRQSLQESGLDWGLHLLNSPHLDTDCRPGTSEGPAFGDSVSLVDERGHRQVRPSWQGRPFACTVDAGTWTCHCPDGSTPAPSTSPSGGGHFTDRLARFSLEFQGQERADASAWHRRTLRLLAQSCAEGQSPCELAGTAASSPMPDKGQAQLVVLSSALAQAPGSAVVGAAKVDLLGLADTRAGLALPPDPDSAWVLQAGGEVRATAAHIQGPPGSTAERLIRRLEPELALPPDAFFQRYFAMPPSQYRERAGLSVLDCRGVPDCSAALEARVRSGHAWLWVLGPLQLRSPLSLGSSENPLLLLCDDALDIDTPLQFHGLIYSHGAARLHAAEGVLRIDGALIGAGAITLAGQVQIVHDAPLMRRLSDLRGSWARLPGGWTP